jgi:hypothetical protein
VQPLLLVDQSQLGLLGIRVRRDVPPLDGELALAELPTRLDGDPFAHRHRAGAGDQAGDTGDQDVLRRDARTGDAHHEAGVRHEAVVDAQHRGTQCVAARGATALEARQRATDRLPAVAPTKAASTQAYHSSSNEHAGSSKYASIRRLPVA